MFYVSIRFRAKISMKSVFCITIKYYIYVYFITLYVYRSFIRYKNTSVIMSSLRLFYMINDWNKTLK